MLVKNLAISSPLEVKVKPKPEAGDNLASENNGSPQLPLDPVRRKLLIGAGVTGLLAAGAGRAGAQMGKAPEQPAGQAETALAGYDPAYVQHVAVPFQHASYYLAETPSLPMIGEALSKQHALPYELWGLLYEDWEPSYETDGDSVFVLGLDKRGPDNRRKRIYMSALTGDLYQPVYQSKIRAFFDRLLDEKNAGKPLIRPYLNSYFDLYWDLHVGVKPDAIPPEVRQIGESFNTVIAFRDPANPIVYENYMKVRALRSGFKEWVLDKVNGVMDGQIEGSEKTFVQYWTKNGKEGKDFRRKDIVIECFHNFFAMSQWGNAIYSFTQTLAKNTGNPAARVWLTKTMESEYDKIDTGYFTPLQRFVMELFRVTTPNPGSISTQQELRPIHGEDRYVYAITPHMLANFNPSYWKDPAEFNPGRYIGAPTSDRTGEEKAKAIGFTNCPFDKTSFPLSDGRKAEMTNSAFGTVYGVIDGKPLPVCDYAGYAPFGFGYRRCPGEQLNIAVFSDFLRKVWADKIEFELLSVLNPEKIPIGPANVIDDNIGFSRPA